MSALGSIVWRSLAVPALLPLAFLAVVSAWVATSLGSGGLGATDAFLGELRHGCLLFAGILALSMAEPLEVARDAHSGPLLLRVAHGGGLALVRRWLGLVVATLPLVLLAALASGGLPAAPGALLAELGVLSAGGLLLGSFLDRGRLVPALWTLAIVGHLRPWLLANPWSSPLAWLLPGLGSLETGAALLHAALWSAAVLLLARRRLLAVCGRAVAA